MNKNKIVVLVCTLLLLLGTMTGCGSKNDAAVPETEKPQDTSTAISGGVLQNLEKVYTETAMPLPVESGIILAVCRRTDGSLAVLEEGTGVYLSKDNGKTWTAEDNAWYTAWLAGRSSGKEAYIMGSLSPDGSVLAGMVTRGEELIPTELPVEYVYKKAGADPAVVEKTFTQDLFLRIAFAENGKIYYVSADKVFSMEPETGELTFVFEGESFMPRIYAWDSVLYVPSASQGIYCFDEEKKEFLDRDPVLDDFIKGEKGIKTVSDTMLAEEGNNTLLMLNRNGFYRHAWGEDTIECMQEQVLYSRRGENLIEMFSLENGEFLLVTEKGLFHYGEGKETAAAVSPEETTSIIIYGLTETTNINQAIRTYEQEHPGIDIKYHAVWTDQVGMTMEDAIKNLNMELLAGSSADILVLDSLQADNYIEKGMLLDLSDVIAGTKEEDPLMEQFITPYMQDGKIYQIPTLFRITVVAGTAELVAEATDLKGYVETAEALRKKYPSESIHNFFSDMAIYLAPNCLGAWQNEDKSINEENLLEYLTLGKLLYEAGNRFTEDGAVLDPTYWIAEIERPQITTLIYPSSYNKVTTPILAAGELRGVGNGFGHKCSAMNNRKEQGKEEENFALFNGQEKNVFSPCLRLGVSSTSTHPAEAKDFIRYLLSEEVQSKVAGYSGSGLDTEEAFPVNAAGFQYQLEAVAAGDEYNISQEQIDHLNDIVSKLEKPQLDNELLKRAVYRNFAKIVQGELTEEQAAQEIVSRMELYSME